jgi:TolA-binding protein
MAGKFSILLKSGSALVAVGLVAGMVPVPAAAQVDARLERIEAQLRAVQRAVFPGGDERFFEPEITQGETQVQANQAGVPSTSALTDVLTRLDAIEAQLARLTAATEVNENALSLLELRIAALEGQASVATEEAAPEPELVSSTASAQPTGVIAVPAEVEAEAGPPNIEVVTPVAVGPTPERVDGVQAIAKPATDDRGDDEYIYGFRLWDAGFYPEAQQQLALFVEQYPDHWRTTYGRNLLGRAFLDAGEPRRAATHFFENYQSNKDGARAPDSLLYLAESMIALEDVRRACIALAEFGDTYPALATGRLQEQYDANRGRVDCE